MTKSAQNCKFGHIFWRIPEWKTSFFCAEPWKTKNQKTVSSWAFPLPFDRCQQCLTKKWRHEYCHQNVINLRSKEDNFVKVDWVYSWYEKHIQVLLTNSLWSLLYGVDNKEHLMKSYSYLHLLVPVKKGISRFIALKINKIYEFLALYLVHILKCLSDFDNIHRNWTCPLNLCQLYQIMS